MTAFASIFGESAAATSRRNSFDPISADVFVRGVQSAEMALNIDPSLQERGTRCVDHEISQSTLSQRSSGK